MHSFHNDPEEADQDIQALARDHDLDYDDAEQVSNIMEEMEVDEDEALELMELGIEM
jgi:hypothetical protein